MNSGMYRLDGPRRDQMPIQYDNGLSEGWECGDLTVLPSATDEKLEI